MSKQNKKLSKADLVEVYRSALSEDVPIDKIEQKIDKMWNRLGSAKQVEQNNSHAYEEKLKKRLPAVVRYGALFLPITFMAIGLYLLGNALVPIASLYFSGTGADLTYELNTPIPRESVLDVTPVVIAEAQTLQNPLKSDNGETSKPEPTIIDAELDYTNLANWFDAAGLTDLQQYESKNETADDEYILDVPAINIENALVKIGGTDLNHSLIQYPGTATPGNPGAPVVFGHSVLRQFYNPSVNNPRRYISIFSKIMTLDVGDDVYITYQGAKYHYRVTNKTEVKPEDVFILKQNYDARQFKLVTCTPEGTYLRRGVVTAQLVDS